MDTKRIRQLIGDLENVLMDCEETQEDLAQLKNEYSEKVSHLRNVVRVLNEIYSELDKLVWEEDE